MKKLITLHQKVKEELDMVMPIVDRVHGPHHPEFHEVRQVYSELEKKLEANQDPKNEFIKLRQLTQDYTVPGDVCETYEAVYNVLAELDATYQDKE